MYQLFNNVILPIFLIVNVGNLYGFIYSYYLYYYNINHKIHKNQIRYHLPNYYNIFIQSIILQNIMVLGMFMVKNNIILIDYTYFSITKILQIIYLLLIDDFYFYFYHRMMHKVPYLYTNIHIIHHKAKSPYPINYVCAHPFEIIMGSVGTYIGILILNQVYSTSLLIYSFIKIFHELDIHSGLRTFFYIRYYGSSEDHEIHHSYLRGNYASTFNYLDRIFGTYITDKFTCSETGKPC